MASFGGGAIKDAWLLKLSMRSWESRGVVGLWTMSKKKPVTKYVCVSFGKRLFSKLPEGSNRCLLGAAIEVCVGEDGVKKEGRDRSWIRGQNAGV